MKMEPVKLFKSDRSFIDLSEPSLQALSHVLRHKELWPKGFVWNYSHCGTCAIGLAVELWKEVKIVWDRGTFKEDTTPKIMATAFPIDEFVAENIFCRAATFKRIIYMQDVTPEMVADDIEAYLVLTGKWL